MEDSSEIGLEGLKRKQFIDPDKIEKETRSRYD